MILRPRAPFDLRATAMVLERAAGNRLDRWDGARYQRLMAGGVVSVRQRGELLEVDGVADDAALRGLLGVDFDLGPFYELAAGDAQLAPVVARLRGLKPQRFPTVWEALCNGVACQQVSLASGLATLCRFGERFGASADGLVSLPPPERVVDADLSGLGFSRQKEAFLRGLAAALLDGALDGIERLPTADAFERLKALRGVGRWTAEYVLLRGLGRYEVFPADDVGAARSLALLFALPRLSPEAVRELVARWGPWKGLVFFYLLGWKRAAA